MARQLDFEVPVKNMPSMFDKQRVQQQFDRSAERYDQLSYVQRCIVDDLLLEAAEWVLQPDNIVDLGCGTGYALQGLSKLYPESVMAGLDLAPSMLNMAAQSLPQVDFTLGDIEALPYAEQCFDLTWSSSAIQWCELDAALSEISRVTKPGGTVMLSTFVDGTLRDWRQLWGLDTVLGHEGVIDSTASRFVQSKQVRSALSDVGLSELGVHSKTYSQSFASFAEAVASVRDLGAGNAEKNRQQGLLSRSRYQRIKKQANAIIEQQGCLTLSYEVLMVVACRQGQ